MPPWTPSQRESHRRSSAKNYPASILNGTARGFTRDASTDAAGFLTEDHDPRHNDAFSWGNLNAQLSCKTPTIEKMSIAVDFGTENSAVAYKLHWKGQNMRPQPGKDHILPSIEKVVFSNCPKVKTQIGWHSETFQMLHGHEVDDAIRRGKLLRGSHVRGIKLTLLDPSGKTQAERVRLENQLKALPREVRLLQDQSGSRRRMRQLTPKDLVSEFIGYLVRHCLHQIATTTGREGLHWPRWDPQTAYRGLDPAIIAKVVLYIAVPSLATPEFVDLIVTAAQRAGFPGAIVAPEPACAQQLLLQRDFETSGGREGHPYSGASIILDVGGGTADVQTLSIVRYNPTEIKEEVLGDGILRLRHIVDVDG
jgi:molecular chaperone DnaK (HSP70)